MAKHFKFSPSSAHRWLTCPGSLQHDAEDGAPASSYATEGTEAHARAAEMLADVIAGKADGKTYVLDEMTTAAGVFAEHCGKIAENAERYAIEKTMQSPVDPDRGGTADFYAVKGDHCWVVDFKYGVGVPIAAEKNPQLLSYALLLAELYPNLKTFTLEIVQPRTAGEAVDSWEATRDDVDRFVRLVTAAAARRDYVAGDHCRWCPVIATCDHLHRKAFEIAGDDFSVEAAADRWPELMKLKPAITKLLDSIPGRMLDAMRKGKTFPGFKAVKALGNRTWAYDETATLRALSKLKIGKRIACEAKLRSPTQLEKLGYGQRIADLVVRPDKGIALAEESDKRPAVVFETVAESFDDVSFLD